MIHTPATLSSLARERDQLRAALAVESKLAVESQHERNRLRAINAELLEALEEINQWSVSRDGTADADDKALRAIGEIAGEAIAKAQST